MMDDGWMDGWVGGWVGGWMHASVLKAIPSTFWVFYGSSS